ncbi:cytochrome c-type biogenesis protein CcmH [Paraconexibacter antarcticus]|uniref:Cytochrome c-type biogenesis protein n=1 Tax=Paraconexibacter antarcticus TaxID=2949664 RepID=A0ABY5DX91_9ACTN|nr:cytochrome c-type biogenesis protein [Paraconexibacter antarcticus]UTI66635.1 cytochrome c-type biogenesis protein CcmH [Paraconexibacter antarcticus]
MSARRALRALVALVLAVAAFAPASAATPRASFNDIEDEVMCVTCNVPLNIANSPQADDERKEIRRLIALGLTKQQVLDRLKSELGNEVLADPPTSGFNITTWLVPIGAVGGVGLLLALTLPRWRRRSGLPDQGPDAKVPELAPDDLRRLDDELGRAGI